MKKACIACGEPFVGRSDKKYCSDSCRNNFNNDVNGTTYKAVRKVNNILKRNRRILATIVTQGRTVLNKTELVDSGFNFSFFTGSLTRNSGDTVYYCYDYGYGHVNDDAVEIIRSS